MEPVKAYGFPRTARILVSSDFHRVRARGRRYNRRHFTIFVLRKSEGPTRLGLTVSRKVGGAVQRNRVKRLVREFFRLNNGRIDSHLDISVVARRGAQFLSLAETSLQLGFLVGLNDCQGSSNGQAVTTFSD